MFYLKGVTHQVSVWVRSRSWGIPCSQAVWGTSTRFSRFIRFILMEQGLLHYRGVPHLVQAGTLCWKLFYFPVWFGGFCCNSDFFGSMKKQHSLHCTVVVSVLGIENYYFLVGIITWMWGCDSRGIILNLQTNHYTNSGKSGNII